MGGVFSAVASVFKGAVGGGSKKKKVTPKPVEEIYAQAESPGSRARRAYGAQGSLLGTSVSGTTEEASTSRTLLGG